MKTLTYRTPNRADIHTGHSTFDRQCDGMTTGNVIGNTQFSFYIRHASQLECNGYTTVPGHLRDYDLEHFKDLPRHVRDAVLSYTTDITAILYEIRHWVGSKRQDTRRKIVHGYILTLGYDGGYQLIHRFFTRHTEKSYAILRECILYLTNESPAELQPVG